MTKFLAGVFSVIALGVMLIAYGLLSPRAAAYGPAYSAAPQVDAYGRPMLADDRLMLPNDPEAVRFAYANGYRPAAPAVYAPATAGYVGYAVPQQASQTIALPMRTVETVAVAPAPQRVVTRTVERAPSRNWKKTAMVIGGSTAAGAGIGGIVGGKKGALIGAAIGGGASTLYESTK